MSKEHLPLIFTVCLSLFFVILIIGFFGSDYINRPFGMECNENFTQSIGNFKTCGRLMSGESAKVGLLSIFIGLPLLAFVVLPLLVKIKRNSCNPKKTEEKK